MKGEEMAAGNRVQVNVFGCDYTLEASLGACTVYANQFAGNIREPYIGNLTEDILRLFVAVEGGEENYRGIDYDVLFGCMWAMGVACDSITEPWREFHERIAHEPLTLDDVSGVYGVVVHELGDGVFFRLPKGFRDDSQSDEE